MTTVELKNILIHKIANINDVSFLEAIKIILDSKSESREMHVSEVIQNEIFLSRKEIEQKKYVDNDVLAEEIDTWLSEK